MKNFFSEGVFLNIKKYIVAHKIVSSLAAIVILFGGYYGYKKLTSTAGETSYIMTTVQKGTIISSISGSGQVSATNKVDVKAKVSGEITYVNVKPGQVVKKGQVLAGIDSTTAKEAVDDAEAALAEAKLQFQKDQAQAPIDYQKSLDDLTTAQNDLTTTYNDTFNTLSTTYLDLPAVASGAESILYGYDLSPSRSQWNKDILLNTFQNDNLATVKVFATSAENDYQTARTQYDAAVLAYKQTSRTSSAADLEAMLSQSIDVTTALAQALQSELNFMSTAVDVATQFKINIANQNTLSTMQTNARNYLTTVNSDLSALLAQQKSINNAKVTIKTDQQNIDLLKVGNDTGSNPISLQISQSDLDKQERSLEDLKTTLSEYTVVAPFDGTISAVTAQVGDDAGTIATIITNQQVAELSLNEVDAAQISIGQKATLTFDAIDGLTLTGTVAEIDSVGTVTQGVVSYTAQITFDTQDSRIKPGMTVNATIQTAVHTDVLYVPSSAVKTANGTSFVQVFNPPLAATPGTTGTVSATPPTQVPVTLGISDDTNVEIISGVTEGEQVVSRTVTAATTGAAATASGARTTGTGGGAARGGGGFGGGAGTIRL